MKIRVTTAFNDRQLIDGGFAEEVKSDAPKKPRTKAEKTVKTEKAD